MGNLMIKISLVRKKAFNNTIQILIILCGVLISSTSFSADNVNSATSVKVEESAIKPLTKQEIDTAIEQMKTKLFLRVDQWNSGLGRTPGLCVTNFFSNTRSRLNDRNRNRNRKPCPHRTAVAGPHQKPGPPCRV